MIFNEFNKMSFIDPHYLCVPRYFIVLPVLHWVECRNRSSSKTADFWEFHECLKFWSNCAAPAVTHILLSTTGSPWRDILGAQLSNFSCDTSLGHLGFPSFGAKGAAWFLWARGTSACVIFWLEIHLGGSLFCVFLIKTVWDRGGIGSKSHFSCTLKIESGYESII